VSLPTWILLPQYEKIKNNSIIDDIKDYNLDVHNLIHVSPPNPLLKYIQETAKKC
jgi:hypothetical protein